MIATSGFLAALECTKFVFGRTPLGDLTALPRPSSWFKGNYFKGKGEGRGAEEKEWEERRYILSVAYLRCRQYVRNSTAALNTHTLIKLLI